MSVHRTLGLANDALLALEHVRAVLEADPGEPIDTVRFLDDVRVGAGLGWNTPLYNRATFDDLLSTGNLSLIRDTELRDALVDYYRGSDDVRARIERRRGDYPMAGFELVPIPVDPPYRNVFDPESTEQSLASILRSVRESRLQSLVTGQENLTAFVAFLHGPLRARALELLSMLDDRLD